MKLLDAINSIRYSPEVSKDFSVGSPERPIVFRWGTNVFYYHRDMNKSSSLNGRFIQEPVAYLIKQEADTFCRYSNHQVK